LIEISGYASNVLGSKTDQKLSEERAAAVARYFYEVQNIPMRRILIPVGYGSTHPLASNANAEGRESTAGSMSKFWLTRALKKGCIGCRLSGRTCARSTVTLLRHRSLSARLPCSMATKAVMSYCSVADCFISCTKISAEGKLPSLFFELASQSSDRNLWVLAPRHVRLRIGEVN
jgi:hypothetical protein